MNTKQQIAILEGRIVRLENMLRSMLDVAAHESGQPLVCAQCGIFDPHDINHLCGMTDCCQGLNPNG